MTRAALDLDNPLGSGPQVLLCAEFFPLFDFVKPDEFKQTQQRRGFHPFESILIC